MTDADRLRLVTTALRRGSVLLAGLVLVVVTRLGELTEPEPQVALVVGWSAVVLLHVTVGDRVRRRLAGPVDRDLDREWAAVEPRWSRRAG